LFTYFRINFLPSLNIYGFSDHHVFILFGLFHSKLRTLSTFGDFLEMADLVSYIILRLNHNTITTDNRINLSGLHQVNRNGLPPALLGHLILVKLVSRMRDAFSVGPVAVVSAATGFSMGGMLKIFG